MFGWSKAKAKRKRKTARAGPAVSRYVDMWAFFKMHPTNIDLLQRLKSADDRQFGANMDVCGVISTQDAKTGKWDKTHLVAIRSDAWYSDQQRRLVLKMFKTTGERIHWVGTVEEITTREIHNSIGSRRAVLTLAVILPDYEFLMNVQQNHRTFRIPSIFTFCFHDEDEKRRWYVDIKRKWFSLGADFVIESGGRKIGEIDGKLIAFGYDAYVRVDEPTLAKNSHFVDLLTLFAASVGYHRPMRQSIRQRVRAIQSGQRLEHVVEDEEAWLLRNPRRRAA
jgi:hypothetical protein